MRQAPYFRSTLREESVMLNTRIFHSNRLFCKVML